MSEQSDIYVRPLNHSEWRDLLEIRLEAVTKHPGYFLSTPKQTKELTPDDWKRRINSENSRIFGLYDNVKLIGITGIYVPDDAPNCAVLVMSYIKPSYRGRGFSQMFYKARLDWAMEQNQLEFIKVSHRTGNKPSKAAILKHGFKFIGADEIDWPDGSCDTEYNYELDLNILRNPHRVV